MLTIKNILCPVDFLLASHTALKYATALAAAHYPKLKLLHVLAPIISNAYPSLMDIVSTDGSMKEKFGRQLENTAKVRAAGIAFESEVTLGDVALEIERVSKTQEPKQNRRTYVQDQNSTHGTEFSRWHDPIPRCLPSAENG